MIINDYPPNIDLIRISDLNPPDDAIYPYGKDIYSPVKKEKDISPDILYHEQIHQEQQGDNPDIWWTQYLTDREFRLEMEIHAYGSQYQFAKTHVKDRKLLRWALENMASALSSEAYGKLLTYGEAESKIRNYGKRN